MEEEKIKVLYIDDEEQNLKGFYASHRRAFDIKTALSLPINHLSAYALTIEEGTPFEKTPHMAQEQLELLKSGTHAFSS